MKLQATLALASLLLSPIWGQLPPASIEQAPAPHSSNGIPTFTSTTSIVVINVAVTDRNGKPIENLSKDDFAVYEDGKLQHLDTCDFQKLGGSETAPPAGFAPRNTTVAAPVVPPPPSATPNLPRYQDRRLIVMLFDFSSLDPGAQVRTRDAALKFLSSQMTPSDMVSIMTFGADLRTVQDFTDDRDLLNSTIRSFHIGESSDLANLGDTGPDAEDQSGTFVADDTEFNIFNTDRKLAALEQAARKLAAYPEKKALVYFSGGVEKTGVENQSQLEATVNAAVRANVAFYPIDARGLLASAPGGDATKAAPVGSGLFSGRAQRSLNDSFQNSQETLYTLASDTGGKALLDSNDLTEGLRQVQHDIGSYYILAFHSTNTTEDGKYRKVQVRLTARLAGLKAKLDYRQGYFAPTTFAKMRASDRESQLQQALESENPVTDLPIAVEIDYFRLAKDKYFVPVTVRIPGSALSFQEKGGKRATALDFIAEVRDARGRPADAVRDTIPLKIDATKAGEVARKHIQYDTGMTLPAGRYLLRFVARENGEGKIGTFQTAFTVPDLSSEKTLRTSSLVLSNQLQAVDQQLAGAKNSKKLVNQNPLVNDAGQKLVPNVTRVFRPNQNLYAMVEVYDARASDGMSASAHIANVASSLAVYSQGRKVFETAPVQLSRFNSKRDNTIQVRFQTALKQLKPGRYTCQLNLIDQLGGKFAFPRASLVVLADVTPHISP